MTGDTLRRIGAIKRRLLLAVVGMGIILGLFGDQSSGAGDPRHPPCRQEIPSPGIPAAREFLTALDIDCATNVLLQMLRAEYTDFNRRAEILKVLSAAYYMSDESPDVIQELVSRCGYCAFLCRPHWDGVFDIGDMPYIQIMQGASTKVDRRMKELGVGPESPAVHHDSTITRWSDAASDAYTAGDYETAWYYYHQILQSLPRDRFLLGRMRTCLKEIEQHEIFDFLDELYQRKLQEVHTYLDTAQQRYDSDDADGYWRFVMRALAMQVDEESVLASCLRTAGTQRANRRYESAMEIYQRAQRYFPDNAAIGDSIAACRTEISQMEERRRNLAANAARITETLGEAHDAFDRMSYDTALARIDEILAIDSVHEEALDLRQRTTSAMRAFVPVWMDGAREYLNRGDMESFQIYIDKILTVDPDNSEAKTLVDSLHDSQLQEFMSDIVPDANWVYIESGTFRMGSEDYDKDERPVHEVTLRGFYIMDSEVTGRQWLHINKLYRNLQKPGTSFIENNDLPVRGVPFEEIGRYIDKLNAFNKGRYRLPTEAEWEFVCRAGSEQPYCFGKDRNLLNDYAWYDDNSSGTAHRIRLLKPNAWGLYDLHGNVAEYCSDRYDDGYYAHSPQDDPRGPAGGKKIVIRGGSYETSADDVRSAARDCCWERCYLRRHFREIEDVGFRLVWEPDKK